MGYSANTNFGIEIEFDSNRDPVARELVERGILQRTLQSGYHAAARSGYADWTFERDGSVPYGGELVTPILSDTADSWAQLREACEAIRAGGGETHGAGSHTNISSPDYTPEMAWRLANLARAYEDDLHRMGRTRRSQRHISYASTLRDPGPRWTATGPAAYGNVREAMINLHNVFGPADRARIEFRFPDASHDPGVMQAQIRLCAAMTNYVRTNEVEPSRHRPMGSSRSEGWTHDLMNQPIGEFARHTEQVRGFIDRLFTSDRERIQIAQLWGRGAYRNWNGS
ncbi:hypothetical protein GCM10027418_17620 [Mariniluteicoccus endophyticus]